MNRFQQILFATDFSEGAREGFRIACSLAGGPESRVIVLHVVERSYVVEESVAFSQLGVPVALEPLDPTRLSVLRERLANEYLPAEPIVVEYDVCEGDPASEILDAAVESGCDLIVMGTHGRSGFSRLLAGSVAEAVMRKAPCPVLTYRGPLVAQPVAAGT